jgi:hypothetical protein
MGVYVREFEPADALAMTSVLEPGVVGHPLRAKWAAEHKEYGPAYTGTRNGEIIACGGIMILWPGVGEAWANFGASARKSPKDILYCIRKGLDIITDAYELIRVQALATPDFPESIRFLKHLGFVEEGYFCKYWEDGRDAVMMAKVK